MFLGKQLDAPSIGMLLANFYKCKSVPIGSAHQFITFISALTLSPLLGTKICHIHYATVYVQLSVGLNLKQRQRQNTDGFSCKCHLLNFRLINTLYHNTVERNLKQH